MPKTANEQVPPMEFCRMCNGFGGFRESQATHGKKFPSYKNEGGMPAFKGEWSPCPVCNNRGKG